MKLAFSTLPCEGWSTEKLIHYCTTHGFAGIELREGDEFQISSSTRMEEVERISSMIANAGVSVTNIGSSVCVKGTSVEETNLAMRAFEQMVPLANGLQATGIRIFLGNFARRYDAPKEQLDYGKIVEFIQWACDYAALHEREVWIETHNEFATGKALSPLLRDVARENCKVIWDVIHSLEDGEEPEETIAMLGNRCVHIHLKDGRPFDDPMQHDWEYTFFGEGNIPIPRIVSLLQGAGFEGYLSLEWEPKWREELRVPWAEAEVVLPKYANDMRKLLERTR
ncbi:sugar phosphate isomerase/epimerase [Paenibacillus oryzisoli]|uniref:sugar phosphate isomerase/epimerase family protein n=1 Tax=Paenibacillus oryzisoli TaxID=1850517 RepID=UPI003D2DEFDC